MTLVQWLGWVRALRAISQTGLHFSRDPFDSQRYRAVGEIAAQMLEQATTLTRADILELNAADLGYATPKVDVRGACFRDGQILLVQETADAGRWTLPGGWADPNETASEAVVREIAEESGYRVTVRKLIGALDREKQGHHPPYPHHVYKLVFLCDIVGGSPRPSVETSQAAFFPECTLPEWSVARTTAQVLHRCFQHGRHPEIPTDFDRCVPESPVQRMPVRMAAGRGTARHQPSSAWTSPLSPPPPESPSASAPWPPPGNAKGTQSRTARFRLFTEQAGESSIHVPVGGETISHGQTAGEGIMKRADADAGKIIQLGDLLLEQVAFQP